MKEKTKNILIDILYFIAIWIILAGEILPRNLANLDEIWNFNFARNIQNGLLPYNDFNMLQTPLLSFILSIFLKIFGQELLVIRFLSIFLGAGIIFLTYKILLKINLSRKWSILGSIVFISIMKNEFYLDYNYAILFAVLLLILMELNSKKNSAKFNLIMGIIAGITILFKQSTGIVISLVAIIFPLAHLILSKKSKERFDFLTITITKKDDWTDKLKKYFKKTEKANKKKIEKIEKSGQIESFEKSEKTGKVGNSKNPGQPTLANRKENYAKIGKVEKVRKSEKSEKASGNSITQNENLKKDSKQNIIITDAGNKFIDENEVIKIVTNEEEKLNPKQAAKDSIIRLIGVALPVILFIIYLYATNSMDSFWSYSIEGIKTFSNKVPYYKLFNSNNLYSIIAILFPITIVYLVIINLAFKREKSDFIIGIYSLGLATMIYPIADKAHLAVAAFPAMIYFILQIILNLQNIESKKVSIFIEHFTNVIALSTILIMTLYAINNIYFWNANQLEGVHKSDLKHFNGIPITTNLENRIKGIDKFIENQKYPVYILDSEAAVYMIPIDKYNKDYDMFLKGNLGAGGEEAQIKRIQETKEAIYLIQSAGNKLNWQTPTDVYKYIQNNLNKIGTMSIFDIYVPKQEKT